MGNLDLSSRLLLYFVLTNTLTNIILQQSFEVLWDLRCCEGSQKSVRHSAVNLVLKKSIFLKGIIWIHLDDYWTFILIKCFVHIIVFFHLIWFHCKVETSPQKYDIVGVHYMPTREWHTDTLTDLHFTSPQSQTTWWRGHVKYGTAWKHWESRIFSNLKDILLQIV